MKQITIRIQDSNFHTFLNFLKTLDYVKVVKKENNEVNTNDTSEKSLAGMLSKESADLFVKHGQEIRNEWE